VINSFSVSPTLNQSKNYVAVLSALTTPLSRGNVSIASNSMKDAPLIDVGWLSDPTDLEVLVQALKRARALFGAESVRDVLLGEEVLPGKGVETEEQIAAYIREGITTVYHASCTCKFPFFSLH
jgi:choline dehydrogenase